MKRILTLTAFCFFAVAFWAQDCTDPTCTPITYYLDIDGDGVGVDFEETNFICCCCEEPSAMFVLLQGDPVPNDPDFFGENVTLGCKSYWACNYKAAANLNDNSCVFPKSCQFCTINDDDTKITDGTGAINVSNYTAGFDPAMDSAFPCDCDADGTALYLDATGRCRKFNDAAFCTADIDSDGICDLGPDGQAADPCTGSATEEEDDCGNCVEPGAGTYFTDSSGDPCPQGTEGCTSAAGKCDCQGQIFDDCDVCGGNGAPEGFTCSGLCTDVDGNEVCDFDEVIGCMDGDACNYDDTATLEDPSVIGLPNTPAAECKYLDDCDVCGGSGIPPGACENTDDDAVCFTYPEEYYDCNGPINDQDNNDIADELDIDGCNDSAACNFRADVTRNPNDECIYEDALSVCGGSCDNDVDDDGICDDNGNDTCTILPGIVDDCGTCNGDKFFTLSDGTTPCVPGTPGCTNDAGECDCLGSTYDVINSCGGNCIQDADGDGICDLDEDGRQADRDVCVSGVYDMLNNCIQADGTPCTVDADGDGLCDEDTDGDGVPEDPCPGDMDNPDNVKDECDVCGGTGIPENDCDCLGSQPDILGVCDGGCENDIDQDGICDDDLDGDGIPEDSCFSEFGTGQIDDCGDCEGPSFFQLSNGLPCDPGTPGCTNVAGECNCSGDEPDVLGICGGACITDADEDGICDDNGIDECVGTYDACGVCNELNEAVSGNGVFTLADGSPCEIGTAGCTNESGWCDCDGNTLDVCGVCGGNGIPDGACEDPDDPSNCYFYPEFGYDCHGTCLNDLNNNGQCDELEEMEIVKVLHFNEGDDGSNFNMYIDHILIQQALDSFELRHSLMSENLEALSLTGSTMNVTLQKSITDKGTLNVKGLSTFNSNMYLKASLNIDKSLYVTESLTIGGTTLSKSGLITSNLSVAGNALVGGSVTAGNSLYSFGQAKFKKRFDISDNFTVYKNPGAATDIAFAVEASSGNVLMRGDLIGQSNINIDGFSEFDRLTVTKLSLLDNARIDGQFRVKGNAELEGSIEVGDGVFTVNSLSGNTFVKRDLNVGRNFFVDGNVHVLGKATIGGTTFANGGIKTTWLEVLGDMNVAGEGIVRLNTAVGQDISVYKDLGITSDFEIAGSADPVFKVSSATGKTTAIGDIDVNTLVADQWSKIDGSVSVDGNLNVAGTIDYGQNIVVGTQGGAEKINLENAVFGSELSSSGYLLTTGTFTTTGSVTTKDASITGGNTILNGSTTVSSTEAGNRIQVVANRGGDEEFIAEFRNTNSSGGHGLLLKSGNTSPTTDNNFFSFLNSAGVEMGRIEGIKRSDWNSDGDYVYTKKGYEVGKAQADFALGNAIFGTALASMEMIAAAFDIGSEATAFSPCFGNGFCVSVPVPSLIAMSIANFAVAAVGVGEAGAGWDAAQKEKQNVHSAWSDFTSAVDGTIVEISNGGTNVGVTYQSGAGDYAEWLPKTHQRAKFVPGQVVGVRGGAISLNTENADHVFVISTLPVVLGNVPERTKGYEKVAFMGQVPVKVLGKVNYGDFIVASGNSDGIAIAKKESDLKSNDFLKIVGVAWEESKHFGLKEINVAVGMNSGLANAVEKIDKQIATAEKKTKALKNVAFSLMQDEKPSLSDMQKAGLIEPIIGETRFVGTETSGVESTIYDGWVVFDMTHEGLELAFQQAIESVDLEAEDGYRKKAWETLVENEELRYKFLDEMKERIDYHNKIALQQMAKYVGVSGRKLVSAEEVLRVSEGSNMNTSNQ